MPTISSFYGILIQMFWNDHEPAHFHVRYGEYKATIAVETLTFIRGRLPARAQKLVIEWAKMHRDELLEDWQLCRSKKTPKKIEPLD